MVSLTPVGLRCLLCELCNWLSTTNSALDCCSALTPLGAKTLPCPYALPEHTLYNPRPRIAHLAQQPSGPVPIATATTPHDAHRTRTTHTQNPPSPQCTHIDTHILFYPRPPTFPHLSIALISIWPPNPTLSTIHVARAYNAL